MTPSAYILLVFLTSIGLAGNYCGLSLGLGIDLVFGSTAVLLIIYLFGSAWGIVASILTSSITLLLWHHPYGFIISIIEALFVALLWRRYSDNLLLLEGVFWLCLGSPLLWILYTLFTPLTSMQVLLIMLKVFVNGITNALIASLIITHLPLNRWCQWLVQSECPSLHRILLNIIIAFVLLPNLLEIVVNDKKWVETIKSQVVSDVTVFSNHILTELRSLHERRQQNLRNFRTLLMHSSSEDLYHLLQKADLLQVLFPDSLDGSVATAQGPLIVGHHIATLSMDQQQQVLNSKDSDALFTFFNYIIGESGKQEVLLSYALPIQLSGGIPGLIQVHFKLRMPESSYGAPLTLQKMRWSLLDSRGSIVDTNLPDPLIPANEPLIKIGSEQTGLWLLPQFVYHNLQQWQRSVYIKQVTEKNSLQIKLIVELPLQGYVDKLQQYYTNRFAALALVTLLSLILATLLSQCLVKPLSRLAHITYDLPNRLEQLEQTETLNWPQGRIYEIETLKRHFQVMAESLQARFDEIHATKRWLEERVQKRTQELQHDRALLRNLIDSIPDFIFYKNCEGVYLGCNKAFEEFVNRSQAEIVNKVESDLFSTELAKLLRSQDRYVLETCQPHANEDWSHYPDGRRVLLNTLKTPFFSEEGKLLGLIGISRDMTARQQAEEQLRQSQSMLRLVMDTIPQCIFWKDHYAVYAGCNQNFARLLGLPIEKIVGKTTNDLIALIPRKTNILQHLDVCLSLEDQPHYHYIDSLPQNDGSTLWLEINTILLRSSQDEIVGILCSFEDISERKRTEEKLRHAAKVFENSSEAICITDAHTNIISVNRTFTQITGYTEMEVIGKRMSILRSGKHSENFYKTMWLSIQTTGRWDGEIWNRRKNGEIFAEWLHINLIKDENERVTNYLGIFSDITTHKQIEQRLAFLAQYDEVTSLPNRNLFYERANRAICRAQKNNTMVAVMFLDLDRFKYINDTWGHSVGDLLLKEVANRLTDCVSENDTVARLGGDDFTVILENPNSSESVAATAQYILDAMRPPFYLNGHETFITSSIGISLYPNDGQDVDTLLKSADTAMYRTKESGKNNYQFFTTQMNTYVHQRLLLDVKLRHAVEREEFLLYYQPQMHLASGHIIGAEVLIRWQSPELGLVTPHVFIPLAEETGLITVIGEWVLRQACLQHKQWRTQGKPILRIGVNLSSRQFRRHDLCKEIEKILSDTNMDPTLLELELTESMLMQEADVATRILHELKEMGIQLAIDDFGTGYSSLNYIKRFPIDKLKIDKSFIHDIPANQNDMAITRAIVALARNLRLSVIAEGVENRSQMAFLKTLRCDEVQGYLVGYPLPEEEFLKLLQKITL